MGRLLQGVGKSSRIIEIGPGYSPVAAKAAGWNTHVVDHTSRSGLREKYATAGVDLDGIEEVDSIWTAGPLHEAVPPGLLGSFDLLIASHLIEHVTDFVGFLVSAQRLLKPQGVLSLAVPDKRFCFDYFKSPTMTGDVLEAHAGRRSRHGIRTVWNSTAYSVWVDDGLAVASQPVADTRFMTAFSTVAAVVRDFRDDPELPYQDHHAWHFTPAGFSLVILELCHLGLIDWQMRSVHGPEGFEFFASLCRGMDRLEEGALQQHRMKLLRQMLEEARVQVGPGPNGAAAPVAVREAELPSGRFRRLLRKGKRLLAGCRAADRVARACGTGRARD